MTKQDAAAHGEKSHQETLTPFIERSISELITLFAQLFTTPFAVVTYNKNFRDQITALARDDIETAYPETVARPLSFFVLLMSAHFLLAGIYWRLLFPAKSLAAALAQRPDSTSALSRIGGLLSATWNANYGVFKNLASGLGNAEAFIFVAFAFTLIIVVKAFLVTMAGRLLRCPVRFETVLHASAYAFGTFIFFQYVFIMARILAASIGDGGFFWGYAIIAYGSVVLAMVLVVRVNQIIRQTDGTPELPTFAAWFIGTVIWHFAIIFGSIAIPVALGEGGSFSNFWSNYSQYWGALGKALYPPTWL